MASIMESIRAKLLADGTVSGYVSTRAYARRAKERTQASEYPYLVTDDLTAAATGYSTGGRFPEAMIQVAAFSITSDVHVRAVADACLAALLASDGALAVSGIQVMKLRPLSEVIVLQDDRNVWQGVFRVGILYRV